MFIITKNSKMDNLIQNWAVVIDKRSLKEALVNFANCPHLNLKVLALHIQIPFFKRDIQLLITKQVLVCVVYETVFLKDSSSLI